MAHEVRVDPAVLDRVADGCRGLRDDALAVMAGVEPQTADAARGLRGWHTARSLENVYHAWRDDLTRLGGYLDRLADAFGACANDYRYADHASAQRFDIRGR